MPQRVSVFTYSRLKSSKPCSLNGSGERSSHAANEVEGRPRLARGASTAARAPASGKRPRGARSHSREARGKRQRPREARPLDLESRLGCHAARELETGLDIAVAAVL